ncbi:MAG TPA: YncE family protein [Nakamurella sp.]
MRKLIVGVLAVGSLAWPGLTSAWGASDSGQGTPGYAVTVIPVNSRPLGIAVDPATDTVYAVNNPLGTLSVINGASNTVTAVISLGSASFPQNVAVDPATDTVYVTVSNPPSVAVIDAATKTITGVIGVGMSPTGVAVDPLTDTVYVTSQSSSSIAVIDGSTGKVTGSIDLGAGNQSFLVALDPVTDVVYVTGHNNTTGDLVWVIDGDTSTVTRTVSLGFALWGVAVDPDTDKVYVADQASNIYVIDGTDNAVIHTIAGVASAGIAVDPVTNTIFAGNVTVIDGVTNKVTLTVPASSNYGIAVNPATGTVYTTGDNAAGGLVSVLTKGVSPVVTSASSATFTVGSTRTFKVTTSGSPAAAVTETGRLPRGLTFTADDAAGTADLTGRPAAGTGGIYPITISASNGIPPAVTEAFRLVVDQAPAIVSASRAVFAVAVRGRFTVRTSAFPASVLTEAGRLPAGIAFRSHPDGTATLAGTPARSAAGRLFTVKVTAANGVGRASVQELTIVIR